MIGKIKNSIEGLKDNIFKNHLKKKNYIKYLKQGALFRQIEPNIDT